MRRTIWVAQLWAIMGVVLIVIGGIRDQSEAFSPYALFAVGASVFYLGVDRIILAIEKK